jgi:hypothetical protein
LNPTNGQTHTQGSILTDPIVSHTSASLIQLYGSGTNRVGTDVDSVQRTCKTHHNLGSSPRSSFCIGFEQMRCFKEESDHVTLCRTLTTPFMERSDEQMNRTLSRTMCLQNAFTRIVCMSAGKVRCVRGRGWASVKFECVQRRIVLERVDRALSRVAVVCRIGEICIRWHVGTLALCNAGGRATTGILKLHCFCLHRKGIHLELGRCCAIRCGVHRSYTETSSMVSSSASSWRKWYRIGWYWQ